MSGFRRLSHTALWGLRAYRGSAILLASTGALALAVGWTIASLIAAGGPAVSPRFGLPAFATWDTGIAWGPFAQSASETQRQGVALLFRLLVIESIALLVVGALTIATVSASRAASRATEMTVRRAVGASRSVLIGGVLLEASSIATVALLVGAAVGAVGARLAALAWPGTLGPAAVAPAVMIGAAVGLCLVAGGLLPALFAGRRRVLVPTDVSPGIPAAALQLGLSLVALVGATLLGRHGRDLLVLGQPAGTPGTVVTIAAPPADPAARAASYAKLLDELQRDPSAGAASLSTPGLLVGLSAIDITTTDCGRCWFAGMPSALHYVRTGHHLVSADTFRLLDLPVLDGRGITAEDDWDAPRVAVVSRTMASRHFEGGRAIGKSISVGGSRPLARWYMVVGVVENRASVALGGTSEPRDGVYLSVLQHAPPVVDLLVRPGSSGSPARDAIPSITAALGDGAAGVPRSEEQVIASHAAPVAWFGRLFALTGWVTLVIATLGTFAAMWLWVNAVRRSLGVRRAVGATRGDVFRYVLTRAAGVGAAGVALALWIGDVVWGTMTDVVPGLPAWDFSVLLPLAALLMGAALAGAVIPARFAARLAPATLIESEA